MIPSQPDGIVHIIKRRRMLYAHPRHYRDSLRWRIAKPKRRYFHITIFMNTSHLRRLDARITNGMQMRKYHTVIMLLDELAAQMGEIPLQYQVTYVKCLFHTGAYMRGIQMIHVFRERGNTSKDLTFAEGLCFYYMGSYDEAVAIFEQHAQWGSWLRKAAARRSSSCTMIQIGDPSLKNCFEIVRSIQTEDKVKLLLAIGGLMRRDIQVSFGYDWFDVSVMGVAEKSFELFAPIVGAESFYHFSKEGLHLTLKKAKPEKWPDSLLLDTSVEPSEQQQRRLVRPPLEHDEKTEREFISAQLLLLGTPQERMDRLTKALRPE